MKVAFRVSVPVRMVNRPLQADLLWGDQPTPPPPLREQYGPDAPDWRVWPPRGGSARRPGETAQQRRIRQTLFMAGPSVQVDEVRSSFTYRRCTLVGTVDLDEESARVWTAHGWSDVDATTALGTVLLLLRCALRNVYEVRPPEHKTISDIPLPRLTLTLREVVR